MAFWGSHLAELDQHINISNFQPYRYGEEKASVIMCFPMITLPYICHWRTPIFEENSRDVYICEGSITQKFLGLRSRWIWWFWVSTLWCLLIDQLQNLSDSDSVWGRTFKDIVVIHVDTSKWGVGVWQGWYSSITLSRNLIFKKRSCEKLLDIEDAHGKDSGMLICYDWL